MNPRTILVHLAILGIFGVWWPHLRGVDFFDPVFLDAYACLGVLFAGPAAAQAFADRPKSFRETMRRLGGAVLYGESMAVLILAAGIATVMSMRPPIGPDWIELAQAAVLGLTGAVAMASVAAWVALRFGPAAARQVLRLLFLGLLVLFFFRSRWLPDVLGRGISISTGISIVVILAIRRSMTAQPSPPHEFV